MSTGSSLFGTPLRSWFFEGNLYLQVTRSGLSNLLLVGVTEIHITGTVFTRVCVREGGDRET